jgi:dihydrolipoamide dehydrogenase
VAVAERIAGEHPHVDFNTVPWVIYTAPEIAWVGQTEQQLKAAGVDYRTGSFPFSANGRARGMGETTGFVKIVADAKTDRVLGVHIVGPWASELIAEAAMAMAFGAASEDIARICHAHPTLSEVTKEAALAVLGRTLNA